MALALTKFSAYGFLVDGPHSKRAKQRAVLTITGLATDVSWDISNLTGTFWTAAKANATYGSLATEAAEDMAVIRSSAVELSLVGGTIQNTRQKMAQSGLIKTYTSAAGAGGAATEAMTLTGLLATDTILSVVQKTKGANSLPLLGYSTQADNALTGIWSANPGAGAVIVVTVLRSDVGTDRFTQTETSFLPAFTFDTASAPTSAVVILEWELSPQTMFINSDLG